MQNISTPVLRGSSSITPLLIVWLGFVGVAPAAPSDRITRTVNPAQVRVLQGHVHPSVRQEFDRGAADGSMHMDHVMLIFKPSNGQQTELDHLLAEQQNPSSPLFHQWLSPEEFGNRFGLSPGDHSKVVAWLHGQGLSVDESARGRTWIAFSGPVALVSQTLHTPIHRFEAASGIHFANTADPSVPDALADVVAGFLGLDDFPLRSYAVQVNPAYNSGPNHYLVPEDYATIYNIAALYKADIDGTGQSIAVVGQSDILISDIRAFRTRYNLPANDPKLVPYGSTDPGFNSAQLEGNLDVEWAGAIAPKATIYYVYGTNAFTAMASAVSTNLAPIISVSYGSCEIGLRLGYWRSIAQQANAQGITILSASGDSGAAGCDAQGVEPVATLGRAVSFPAVLPEVTAVGGTQFVEGSGNYWSKTNSPNFGSALANIPEAAWNESGAIGLLSTGGGASSLYGKPVWQAGAGVPNDGARDVPDVSLSAALHDGYSVNYMGSNIGVGGTSASTPSLAGIIALLNQYQIANKFQSRPGLGNINPQLYRLAQNAPQAFHDVTAGNNIVSCAQGSPDCSAGSFGYRTGAGYDLATGLGSIDVDNLFLQWNSAAAGVKVTLSLSASRATLNDTVQATVAVAPATGNAIPTGTVEFSANGIRLGSVTLASVSGQQTATLSFPLYLLGTGARNVVAQYSGDAVFSSGGATKTVQVTTPSDAAAIMLTWPDTVWPVPDPSGLAWQTAISLSERAGIPALITSFTIDGQQQPLSKYFPSPNVPANSSVSMSIVLRDLATPLARTFGFAGVDANGQTWTRQVTVNYLGLPPLVNFNVTATPLTVTQNTAAPGCQWAMQLNLDELGGNSAPITRLLVGYVDHTAEIPAIFGSSRLNAWGGLQGTLCINGITPPLSDFIEVDVGGAVQDLTVSFTGPPVNPAKLSSTASIITLAAPSPQRPVQATLPVNLSDKTVPWTAAVFPANRTTAWLTLSQYSGTGPAQIALTASGTGFEPGVYRATIVIQSPASNPQLISVPIMFTLGASTTGMSIAGIASAFTTQTTGSPGMIVSVYGTGLASTVASASEIPLPFTLGGVSATVNGLAAPLTYVSPNQINLQIPYEAGSGPAVLGINNLEDIAGFAFQIAPSAPGVIAALDGSLLPNASIVQGGSSTLYLTGAGDVFPAVSTAFAPLAGTSLGNLPKPLLPLSLTVGGVPVFLRFVGITPSLVGTVQVNFTVPTSVPLGTQPLVVTVGGAVSPPVSVNVQAAGQ